MDPSSSNLDGISVSWGSLSLGCLGSMSWDSFGKYFEAEGDVEVNQEVCEEAQKELPILADENQGNNSPSQSGTSRTPKKLRTIKGKKKKSFDQAYREEAEVNQEVHKEAQKELPILADENQGNNSLSQPSTARTPKKPRTIKHEKKRLYDRTYRWRLKNRSIQMQIDLSKLGKEREERKRANESLINEKILAEQKLQQVNTQVAQLGSQVRSLNRQHAKLRILVDAFVKKMCDNYEIDEQLKHLNDEHSSIEIGWENWMFEKLEHLNRVELLKNQNRILNVQVEALWEKKYKLQHAK